MGSPGVLVGGVDEAGRGCLAGPVVAAAVILGRPCPSGIDDSKKLPPEQREHLFRQLRHTARIGVSIVDVQTIDSINILAASLRAMAEALGQLSPAPEVALVDGLHCPDVTCEVVSVVKGDQRSLSIAAASIVAKVTRDRLMRTLAAAFPGYGWERNVGYGTPEHRSALQHLGPTPHHRRTFAPVAAVL